MTMNNINQPELLESGFGPEIKFYHSTPRRSPSSHCIISSEMDYLQKIESHRSIQIVVENKVDIISPHNQIESELLRLPIKRQNNQSYLKDLLKQSLLQKFKNALIENAYFLPKHIKFNRTTRIQKILNSTGSSTQKSLGHKSFNKLKLLVLQPSNYIIRVWDILSIIFYLATAWYCAILVSFEPSYSELQSQAELVIIYYIVADSLLTCNKGIIVQGEVVTNRLQILKHYLEYQFIEDLISFVYWMITYHDQIQDINILHELLTIIQLYVLIRKIDEKYKSYIESFCLKGIMNAALDLLVLTISTFLFAHFLACTWHFIGVKSQYLGKSWLIKYELVNESIWVRYNYSFYWATMTMVTVGYGDITAQNDYEVLCSSIMMFISTCVFAYTMNSIGLILKNLYDQKSQYNRSLALINGYMIDNQVDYSVQSRVRNYIKYYMNQDNLNNAEEVSFIYRQLTKVINYLPNSLKLTLNTDIQMRAISKIKVLTENFTYQTLQQLSQNLELCKFTPDELIFHQDDYKETNLSNRTLQIVHANQTFGEYQFFTSQGTKTAAMSATFTSVYKIQLKLFHSIISLNQKDFEGFHNIKEELIFNQNYGVINISCSVCKKQSHNIIDCPCISYKPNLELLIKKEYFEQQDSRMKYQRSMIKRVNTLAIKKRVEDQALLYQTDENKVSVASMDSEGDDDVGELAQDTQLQKGSFQKSSCSVISNDLGEGAKQLKSSIGKKGSSPSDRNESTYSLVRNLISGTKIEVQQADEGPKVKRINKFEEVTIGIGLLDEFQKQKQFHCQQIDKMQIYDYYMPYNNVTNVLTLYEKYGPRRDDSYLYRIASRYSIYHKVKMQAIKLRMHFQKPITKKKTRKSYFFKSGIVAT